MSEEKQTLFQKISVGKDYVSETEISHSKAIKIIRMAMFLVTLTCLSFFFIVHISDDTRTTYIFTAKSGDFWNKQAIIAQYSFPIYKEYSTYIKEVNAAKEISPLVFTFSKNPLFGVLNNIDSICNKVINSGTDITNIVIDNFSQSTASKLIEMKTEDRVKLFKEINKNIQRFYNPIYKQILIDTNLSNIKTDIIKVYSETNTERIFPKSLLTDYSSYLEKAKDFIRQFKGIEATIIFEFIQKNYRPNLLFSPKYTEEAKQLAGKSVARTDGFVHQGEVIISKGELVTQEITNKILSYHIYKYKGSEQKYTIWMILGNILHAVIILLILIIYLYILRKRIWKDITQLGVIYGVLIFVGLMSWLSLEIRTSLPIEFLIFLPGLSMLIAIAFDSRTAFYVTVTMALLLTGIRGNDYDTGTAMMFAGILAAYSVRDIQSRTQMFKSILFIFVGFVTTIVAFGLERSLEIEQTGYKLILSLLNSIASPLITFGLLIIVERFSTITTDLRLEEYNNLSHPILLKMSEMAPGTYQHTLSLSVLAEKCAQAIGANKLLAKVGAYFHDIGKLIKPEYFVENQLDMGNKHDLISPKRSADAIRNHVIEGINLAIEYKLPQRIVDFIPMHHGTSLIKHFYAKALDDADGMPVNESDFRYPGPKPNSKETAIVMICDTAEAMSRLPMKSKEDLERAIDNTIQSRLIDGQFDECDLTINDLSKIKAVCLKNLYGSSHPRVEYKEIPKDKV